MTTAHAETAASELPLAAPRSLSQDERERLVETHPVMRDEHLVLTGPIEELYREVRRVILLREPGCFISGPSGIGKTSALRAIVPMIRDRSPTLPIFTLNMVTQGGVSIRGFFKHLLSTICHKDRSGETEDLRDRIITAIEVDAVASGCGMAVMLVDEAQVMSIADFRFLKDVSNDLAKHRVQLITILMAESPAFGEVIASLKRERATDLVSRFTMRSVEFRALNSESDIRLILKSIDEQIFPKERGIRWTEFFLPNAFTAGFRLEAETPLLLHALEAACSRTLNGVKVFPARQLFVAIRAFLVDNAAHDSAHIALPNERWTKAIEYALLEEALRLVASAEGEANSPEVIL